MDHLDFVNKSLRLRYEAFSKFATNINQAKSLEAVGTAIASDIKFVIDAFILRLTMMSQQGSQTIELFRGNCTFYQNHHDSLTSLERSCMADGLPLSLEKKDIENSASLKDSIFSHPKTNHLLILPTESSADQKLILFIANKSIYAYTEVDFRFASLISELLTTKISQLLLIKKIAENYKALTEANQQLSQLNEEVNSLNNALEIKVEERTHKLKEAHHELNTLFYRTSHDFRRPLSAILGLVNLIEMNPSPEEVIMLTPHLKNTVQEMDNMLHKLQTISLTEIDDEAVELINFEHHLLSLKDKFAVKLKENNIDFTYRIEQEHKFYTHPMILEAILENILENAICYSDTKQAFICLEVIEEDTMLFLEMKDNGDGISNHLQDKVFDMYFKASERSTGNGLGLYIVKKLVEKLQGSITLKSKLRQGTSIKIAIPYRPEYASPESVEKKQSSYV